MILITPSDRAVLAQLANGWSVWVAVAAVSAFALLCSGTTASAQQEPAPTVNIAKETWVVGRDTAIGVTGQLPVACAGTTVEAALYTRGAGAADNPRDDLIAPVAVMVAAGGSFHASLPLPARLPSGLRTAWLGVAGQCLPRPVFFSGTVYFAVADPIDNEGFAGTFVVPASVLRRTANIAGGRTLGESVGMLTALTDDAKCATVNLAKGPAIDADGNARLHVGGVNQPPACSREGATVWFVDGHGRTLFEKRTLMVGVSQPLANMAPEPPDRPTATPLIVGTSGILPPGPVSPIRTRITWLGDPSDVGYEIERSATQSETARDFGLLATVPASERGADGFFSYTETAEQNQMRLGAFVCYRVRAAFGGAASAYSQERCLLPPVRDGGAGPFPPVTGSARAASNGGIPRVAFIAVVLVVLGGLSLAAGLRAQ